MLPGQRFQARFFSNIPPARRKPRSFFAQKTRGEASGVKYSHQVNRWRQVNCHQRTDTKIGRSFVAQKIFVFRQSEISPNGSFGPTVMNETAQQGVAPKRKLTPEARRKAQPGEAATKRSQERKSGFPSEDVGPLLAHFSVTFFFSWLLTPTAAPA